jgi:WD40 repeat protein
VGILWRGGRPLKKTAAPPKQPAKPAKVNGTNNDAIMIIDSDDDDSAKAASQPTAPEAEFEDDEEELDPDQPYPSFVQQVRISLNTEVLHIAVPQIPAVSSLRPADTIPAIFSKKIIFTVACADCTVRVITLPLGPPPQAAKEKPLSTRSQFGEEVVKVHGHQSIARGVTMTWTSRSEPDSMDDSEDDMDVDGDDDAAATTPGRRRRKQQSRSRSRNQGEEGFDLLVASHSAELGGLLKIWRFQLDESSLVAAHPIAPYKTLTLRKPASRVAFNTAQYPKRRHSQLLIADATGTARIYDVFAPSSHRRASGSPSEPGAFVATFTSTFESAKGNAYSPAILAARKPILDIAWVSDGHHILTLLGDGEWGIWDVDRSGPSPPANPSAFSLRGFVGTSEKEGSVGGASSPKKSGRSLLAPMTPNTRRRKEEVLFQGSASSTAIARGGISVASLPSSSGTGVEDSVIIWYQSEVYKIADLAKFWARTASSGAGNSLPSPGLTQMQDMPLLRETITSISQFDTTSQASRMAVPIDSLISAEHRLVITTGTARPLGRDLNAMFVQEQAETEEARKTDQALLSQGELDLGGMDRLLEDMEGSGAISKSLTLGNPRKVLFASSAA